MKEIDDCSEQVCQQGFSTIPTLDDAEGCGLAMAWCNPCSVDTMENVNVAMIELKNRHDNDVDAWRKKLKALMSNRNLVWHLNDVLGGNVRANFHIVFVGREGVVEKITAQNQLSE